MAENVSVIKNGLCFELNGEVWTVVEFLHVKPGKGPAFVRTKIKSLKSGKTVDNTFNGSAKLDVVRIERRKFQYLYNDGDNYNFMDNETFEQIALDPKLLTNPKLLKEGENVDVLYHADKGLPLLCEMPQYVILQVTQSDPGVKGDTATNVTKPATLETGAEVKVPLFINEGDKVKINTSTNEYMERIK